MKKIWVITVTFTPHPAHPPAGGAGAPGSALPGRWLRCPRGNLRHSPGSAEHGEPAHHAIHHVIHDLWNHMTIHMVFVPGESRILAQPGAQPSERK